MAFPYDQSFKLVTDEDVRGSFTLLAGIPLDPDAVIESLDREINPERLHADHLYRIRSGGRECIHHFEALTYYRSDWVESQMEHAIYVKMKYRLPVFSHLLLFQKRGTPAAIKEKIVERAGGLTQQLKVNIIRIWQRPAAEVLSANSPALYPWTALMDATVDEQREAASRIKRTGREGLQTQMTLLGSLRYGSREAFLRRVGRMFLTKDILRETPFWQEIEREGEIKGEVKGKAEGIADGERRILTRFLVARFGPLPEWAERKISAADTDALERWSEQTANASSLQSALA